MSANTKIVVLRRKELLYTGIFAALGVLFVILLLMLLLPGKAVDTSGAPDSPDSTAETVMPDNVADLGRIPQSAQMEDVSTGAVADTDAVLDNASGPVGTDNTYIPGIYTTELILGSETVNVEVIVNDHAITSLSLADPDETPAGQSGPYDLRCISSQRTAFRGGSPLCVKACGAAGRGHGIYF